jgi:predicted HicB family RNase H-like nuclease
MAASRAGMSLNAFITRALAAAVAREVKEGGER